MDTRSYTGATLSGSHRGGFIDALQYLSLCMACQCCKKTFNLCVSFKRQSLSQATTIALQSNADYCCPVGCCHLVYSQLGVHEALLSLQLTTNKKVKPVLGQA